MRRYTESLNRLVTHYCLLPSMMPNVAAAWPVLTGLCLFAMSPAKPLKNIGKGTCYVHSVVQSWVTNCIVANIGLSEWKQHCGCGPMSSCWLCQFGVNVASSRDLTSKTSEPCPSWILRRIPWLMPAGSSKPKRNKPDHPDPEQVRVSKASAPRHIKVDKLTKSCLAGRLLPQRFQTGRPC